MEGALEGVNKEMKESQAVAGFAYADFEASIASFDSSFQVSAAADLHSARALRENGGRKRSCNGRQ